MLPPDEKPQIVVKEEEKVTEKEDKPANDTASLKTEIKETKQKSDESQPIPSTTLDNKKPTNKVKGHTKTAMVDVNQKIDKLIKKAE